MDVEREGRLYTNAENNVRQYGHCCFVVVFYMRGDCHFVLASFSLVFFFIYFIVLLAILLTFYFVICFMFPGHFVHWFATRKQILLS